MVKQYMAKDEWWPVFSVETPEGPYQTENAVEVPDEIVAEYLTAEKAFSEVQLKLGAIYRENFKR